MTRMSELYNKQRWITGESSEKPTLGHAGGNANNDVIGHNGMAFYCIGNRYKWFLTD